MRPCMLTGFFFSPPKTLKTGLALIAMAISLEGIATTSETDTQPEVDTLKQEAKSIAFQFASTLKPQLKAALESGGLPYAIEVCSVKAPLIAQTLSEQTEWHIKRVSLKARNTDSATPDLWETAVLKRFNQRHQNGEAVKPMAYSEIVLAEPENSALPDQKEFRFMKAQGVEPLCLSCHGKNLSPAVQQVLSKHYPDDQATGYSLGQVRGALSLRKPL